MTWLAKKDDGSIGLALEQTATWFPKPGGKKGNTPCYRPSTREQDGGGGGGGTHAAGRGGVKGENAISSGAMQKKKRSNTKFGWATNGKKKNPKADTEELQAPRPMKEGKVVTGTGGGKRYRWTRLPIHGTEMNFRR